MYVNPNFRTKKALKDAIAKGEHVTVFSQGIGQPKQNGRETIEGPHYPEPHRWYAQVEVRDGRVVKVLS